MTAMIICPARFYTVVLVDSQTSPFSGFALNDMGWFSDKWILSVQADGGEVASRRDVGEKPTPFYSNFPPTTVIIIHIQLISTAGSGQNGFG
jgi:hypothetical protein